MVEQKTLNEATPDPGSGAWYYYGIVYLMNIGCSLADDDATSGHVGFTEPVLDLVDEVEETHATILEKLDEIKLLREKLRSDYVPSTIVSNLEQCIKETEVRPPASR